jgi:hypothetical protein
MNNDFVNYMFMRRNLFPQSSVDSIMHKSAIQYDPDVLKAMKDSAAYKSNIAEELYYRMGRDLTKKLVENKGKGFFIKVHGIKEFAPTEEERKYMCVPHTAVLYTELIPFEEHRFLTNKEEDILYSVLAEAASMATHYTPYNATYEEVINIIQKVCSIVTGRSVLFNNATMFKDEE